MEITFSQKIHQIQKITDFSAPELDIYARFTEGQLLNRHEPEKEFSLPKVPGSLNALWMPDVFPYPF